MEPTVLRTDAPHAATEAPTVQPTEPATAPAQAPRLDLSRMEPPRRLKEARLEEVTIDGICGVY